LASSTTTHTPGTSDETLLPTVTHDHPAAPPSTASGARWGKSSHSLAIMTPRTAVILTTAIALVGCAHSRSASLLLGVKVGETLVTDAPSVVYECREWQSTLSIWFSEAPAARCIKGRASVWPEDEIFFEVPARSEMRVIRIKELNLVDANGTLIYVEIGQMKGRYIINETFFKSLKFLRD